MATLHSPSTPRFSSWPHPCCLQMPLGLQGTVPTLASQVLSAVDSQVTPRGEGGEAGGQQILEMYHPSLREFYCLDPAVLLCTRLVCISQTTYHEIARCNRNKKTSAWWSSMQECLCNVSRSISHGMGTKQNLEETSTCTDLDLSQGALLPILCPCTALD